MLGEGQQIFTTDDTEFTEAEAKFLPIYLGARAVSVEEPGQVTI